MTTRRLFLAALTTLGVTVAAPTTATAFAPVWQTPSVASNPGADTAWPHVVSAPDGSVTIFWQQSDGANVRTAANTRNAAGVWSGAEFLGSADDTASSGPEYPVAVAGDGSLTAAWAKADHSGFLVAVKQPGSGWTDPSPSTGDAGEYFTSASMVAGPDNSTMLLTTGGIAGDNKLRLRMRPAGSDTFTLVDEIDQPDGEAQDHASIAFSGNGDAIAAWREDTSGDDEVRVARYDGPSQSFVTGSAQTIATDASGVGGGISVAINDDGDAAAVWGNQSYTGLTAATREGTSGDWSGPDSLLVAGPNVVPGKVAADGDGNFVTLWQEADFGAPLTTSHAYSRTHPRGGSWSTAEDVAEGLAGAVDLAANASGDMVGSMYTGLNGTRTMAVAYRASGSTEFEPPRAAKSGNVTGDQYVGVPVVSIDPQGNAAVAFPQIDGSSIVTGFAGGDGAAPSLSNVNVPTSATAGDTVSFSSSAFDLWSDLGATTWEFGDGTTETGNTVGHVYTAAGTYTVRVTSTDLAGFAGSETRQITVAAAPAPPAPPAPPVENKPPVLAPVIENRLSGKTVTLTAKVTLRAGKQCTGKATATTSFGNTTYRTTLKLAKVGKDCVGTGTIKLKKSPSTRTKLRVTVSSKNTKTRTVTTKRG